LNIDIVRKAFTNWIMLNWEQKHHDFRIKDDGEYWSWAMQDAWEVWQASYKFFKNTEKAK